MISRRALLQSLSAFGVAPTFAAESRSKKTLVFLFLRGAVDGLSMVPPIGDPAYLALRPSLAIRKPLALDATFGLHPSMASLAPMFAAKRLAFVHAAGLPLQTRSHFDAQDFLESGTPGRRAPDGWLNRAGRQRSSRAPLSMVALQNALPVSMIGEADALAFSSLKDFKVSGAGTAASFEALYDQAVDEALRVSGSEAFDSLALVKNEGLAERAPQNGAAWPKTTIARRLQDISRLVHADVGLSIAATEVGGFDTHAGQGAESGQLANRLKELFDALAVFATDLGPRLDDVTLLAVTEFGRTAKENGTRGTDHGTASAALVLGGGVKGGRVVTDWPGLSASALHDGRDLRLTTDLRSVMTECLDAVGLSRREVFPDFNPARVGLFA